MPMTVTTQEEIVLPKSRGKAKPRSCNVVEVNRGSPDAELRVCAPEGYIMKSFTGEWYRNLALVKEADR